MAEKMLVVDGNSIVNRAFYGVRLLTNSKGMFTNAVYGFLNILYKYLESENPDYVCIAFDVKHPTFRHIKYPEYKAGRHAMPEELKMQIPVLKDVLRAMNVKIIELPGFEADDILGTISEMCNVSGIECDIVTGDRDALQLATDTSKIFLTSTKGGNTVTDIIDKSEIFERFGITPDLVIDAKGLMGDSSDNIPGVAGIGEKTAYGLVRDYGSLEAIYENIENIKGKLKEKLEAGKENAFFSREIATICKEAPIDCTLEDCRKKEVNEEELHKILSELELSRLIKKLDLAVDAESDIILETKVISDAAELNEAVLTLCNAKQTALYIFKVGADPVGVCASDDKTAYYFDFTGGLLSAICLDDLKPLFESNVPKIMHYSKDERVYLESFGINLCEVEFDTAVAAYIIDPARSKYDVETLLGISLPEEFSAKGKSKKTLLDLPADKVAEVGSKICSGFLSLREKQLAIMREREQLKLYYDIEMPLSETLAEMEIAGFKVDKEKLAEFSHSLDNRIDELKNLIYEQSGEEFNVNSTKQLGVVLFEKMGLPTIRKTKTGYSTDSDVLDKLEPDYPIISYIKEYRTLVKLKSTYCEGLLNVIDPRDGKIHSRFMQTVAQTGRISSTEPNLQNIPVRMELGREIRKMFVVSNENNVLIDGDYSQIELRVLAHIAQDENMINAFNSGADIHAITASQVFGVPLEEVTSKMRSNAKAVNFGIVYGISDFALGVDLGITRKQAKAYIEGYLDNYSGVKNFMSEVVGKAERDGFTTTLLGRRRYIPELKSTKFTEHSFGQRIAMNTPIQGSAADIIKIAMVRVCDRLKKENLEAKLILQVHDELILEAPKEEEQKVKQILEEEMENALSLKVPLTVNIETGKSWYECK